MSAHKLDTWRLTQLVDEPLYCAAPSPTHPDDVICYDSDQELDSSARLAKRQRYEAAGQQFLRGERPRLLSARLKGPFEASSGWVNPWLPKASSKSSSGGNKTVHEGRHHPVANSRLTAVIQESHQETTSASMVSQQSFLQVIGPLSAYSARAHPATPDTHIHVDKRTQIQVWADNVERGLPDDDVDFWNPRTKEPDQDRQQSRAEDSTPSDNQWLKKTPLKRKRPDVMRDGSAGTADEPPTILRSVSDPTSLHQRTIPSSRLRRHEASSLLKSRSFELTTPSSIADPRPVDAVQEAQYEALSVSDCHLRTNHMIQRTTNTDQVLPSETTCNKDRAERGSETQQDSSFHVRPRRLRKVSADDGEAQISAQPLIQTETPESSHHPDESAQPQDPTNVSDEKPITPNSETLQDECNHSVVVKVEEPEHGKHTGCLYADASKQQHDTATASPSTTEHNEHATLTANISRKTPTAADEDNSYDTEPATGNVQQELVETPVVTESHPEVTDSFGLEAMELDHQSRCLSRISDTNRTAFRTIAFAASHFSRSTQSPAQQVTPQRDAACLATGQLKEYDGLLVATGGARGDETKQDIGHDAMRSLPLATMAVETAEQVQQPDPCSEPPRADLASTAGEVSFLEPSHQSAWNAYDHSNLAPQVELQSTIAGNLLEAAEEREIIQLPQGSPQGTPPPAECPVASFGLKSFSRFNTPSPQRRASRKSYSRRSTGQLRGILSNNTPRRATLGTKRRVTFAALPGGVEEEQEGGVSGELILRPTSPPPRASAAMGDEDISGHFQKHFESMKRNKSRRLGPDRACALPSLSDNTIPGQADVPAPEVAEQLTSSAACGPPATPDRSDDAKAATNADIYDPAALQSPWRQDTQSEMIDDVAAVMGNLDAFLDAWSMEHEVQKASQPVDQENSRGRDQSKGKSPGIRSGLQELSMWN